MSRKGMVVVFTGDGKGKTTAALGMSLRAVGYGFKVTMIQFVKGSWRYGELTSAERLKPEFELRPAGRGFVGIIDDKLPMEEHRKAAAKALEDIEQIMTKGQQDVLILDEVFVARTLGLITEEQILRLLDKRPEALHLVLTGRGCPQSVTERADLVTEMREIKHPFRQGRTAEIGIDF
ncbi:MAG: cob(I)yrinic acid a,c-diamide adenosyltransferase [Acidobacteriota bacterium]